MWATLNNFSIKHNLYKFACLIEIMPPRGRVNGIELTEIDEFTANVKIPTVRKEAN